MRIVILGAGSVGVELFGACSGKDDVVWLDGRAKCDITDAQAVESALHAGKPDIVINAAAYTDVDGAERERDKCFAVNALGARHIASACREIGAKMIHLSTDMVFGGPDSLCEPNNDGRLYCPATGWAEADKPDPVNTYGRSKLEGEQAVEQHLGGSMTGQYCIVRTSWILGCRGILPFAVKTARQGGIMPCPSRVGRPTIATDLAAALVKIAEWLRDDPETIPPILHFTNTGEIERNRLLRAVDAYVNPRASNLAIVPGTIVGTGIASRAQRSVLDCRLYETHFGHIPHWAAGFARAIEAVP